MSRSYEGERHDLFDFPEVDGLEEFGLVPPVPEGFQVEPAVATEPRPAESITPDPATAAPVGTASVPDVPGASAADDGEMVAIEPARPNPPTPEGIADLDEDLFQFDEIFSLDEDPYFNGTLDQNGAPTNPIFLDEVGGAALQPETRAVSPEAEPIVELVTPLAPTPPVAPATVAPVAADDSAAAPVTPATSEPTLPESITPAAAPAPERAPVPLMAAAGETIASSRSAAHTAGATTLDRGPRLLLPEDVPYSATGERQRYVWALIACFLLVNTGIFVLAHQASSNFQNTMSRATGLLADAITHSGAAPTHAAAPVVDPYFDHTIAPQVEEPEPAEPWIESSGYGSPHEFAVANAKALLSEGRFEDARRRLNYVLANKSRMPLAPSLREEIDYLIPLTYYEQGNATAPETDR